MNNINLIQTIESTIENNTKSIDLALNEYLALLTKDKQYQLSLVLNNSIYSRVFKKQLYSTIIFLTILAEYSKNKADPNDLISSFVTISSNDDENIKFMKVFYIFRYHLNGLKLDQQYLNTYEEYLSLLLLKLQEQENSIN